MKNIKKLAIIVSVILVGSTTMPVYANETITSYNSIVEWENSGDESEVVRVKNLSNRYLGGYTEYRYVETKRANDIRVGYHPDFPYWNYWDGYYFSTNSKVTFRPSVSLSWGSISVGVSVSKSSNSGTYKKADGSKRSRPWVRADITTKIYDVYVYDESGRLLAVNKNSYKVSTSSDVQVFIDHR
ncbi:MAG: hypothetical protein ACRDCC_00920 [Culicoidibacterales bacterium]